MPHNTLELLQDQRRRMTSLPRDDPRLYYPWSKIGPQKLPPRKRRKAPLVISALVLVVAVCVLLHFLS